MKKITFIALAAIAIYSCNSSHSGNTSGFEIKGNLLNSKGESIYLEKLSQQYPQLELQLLTSFGENTSLLQAAACALSSQLHSSQ